MIMKVQTWYKVAYEKAILSIPRPMLVPMNLTIDGYRNFIDKDLQEYLILPRVAQTTAGEIEAYTFHFRLENHEILRNLTKYF